MPNFIDAVVTQLPDYPEGTDVDAYVAGVSDAVVMLKPWMHHLCRVWVRAKDAYKKFNSPERPDCFYNEVIGLPWRVAFAIQAKGLYLYTCLAMKPKDKAFDHEYLFLFKPYALPHAVEFYHRTEWPIEGESWLEKVVNSAPIMTTFYDPYQNQKIREFVKKHERKWLGDT